MVNWQIEPEERHILMQEWASVIQYWATDNSILWQRCSVFLLVNSIFFAPLALVPSDTFLPICFLRYGIPILAVLVNVLWWLVNLRSIACIRHFEQRAEEIRKQIPLLRFYNCDGRKSQFCHWYERVEGKKHILNLLPGLFLLFWLAILAILVKATL